MLSKSDLFVLSFIVFFGFYKFDNSINELPKFIWFALLVANLLLILFYIVNRNVERILEQILDMTIYSLAYLLVIQVDYSFKSFNGSEFQLLILFATGLFILSTVLSIAWLLGTYFSKRDSLYKQKSISPDVSINNINNNKKEVLIELLNSIILLPVILLTAFSLNFGLEVKLSIVTMILLFAITLCIITNGEIQVWNKVGKSTKLLIMKTFSLINFSAVVTSGAIWICKEILINIS